MRRLECFTFETHRRTFTHAPADFFGARPSEIDLYDKKAIGDLVGKFCRGRRTSYNRFGYIRVVELATTD